MQLVVPDHDSSDSDSIRKVGIRAVKARKRDQDRDEQPRPWHHFRLPRPSVRPEFYDSDNSDSEDDLPKRHRIAHRTTATETKEPQNSIPTSVEQHLLEGGRHPPAVPHSCSYCAAITVDVRRQLAKVTYRGDAWGRKGWTTGYRKLPLTVAGAKVAGRNGCAFYAYLVAEDDPAYSVRNEIWGSTVGRIPYEVRMQDSRCGLALGRRKGEFREFSLYSVPGQKTLHEFLGNQLPPNLVPNSQLSFINIRGWLSECRQKHSLCNSFQRAYMPKRLIEVTRAPGSDTIHSRLVTKPPLAPYAALSYCWGGDQKSKTVKSVLAAYEKEIAMSTLPQTLQDALAVTDGVGLRYLWVDAMAIVQDDDDDKDEQISQMHRIYLGASFTIVAAKAVTSLDGFLAPREKYQPTIISARLDDNAFGEILAVPKPDTHDDYNLFTRGWTFQETQLSTRILAYGSRELVYTCLEAKHRDGGYEHVFHSSSQSLYYDDSGDDPAAQMTRHLDPGNQQVGHAEHPLGWGTIVSKYSKRFLTDGLDKLPAISAIAEEYSLTKRVTEYYAGLWKEDFLQQCLWEVSFNTARRPKEVYRAPSWSWASVDGAVDGAVNVLARPYGEVTEEQVGVKCSCSLLHVETTLVSTRNRFGRVSGGFMRLRGRMRKVLWSSTGIRAGHAGRAAEDPASKWPEEPYGFDSRLNLTVDDVTEWPRDMEVEFWCVEFCTFFRDGFDRGRGLLLERANGQEYHNLSGEIFRRVGVAGFGSNVAHPYWFDDGVSEWREIVVV
ncbi:heterokaryon incompatibility protein-domain-containing protein [Triangularia verruculosa]|uniref:Heterokaryon incompatibility protein-domain-containing protein n=1 Tax=Triangularia verruculosa TaxID=2587418 RepID=A0AAN7AT16_9PEZI|nr:heterokaryon incompatibility protein-domain-containing protein [Triangularia verruculosa]